MKLGEFLFGREPKRETRRAIPLDTPIPGSVPLQHISAFGIEGLSQLPVARKCIGYIADQINDAEPQIIETATNKIVATRDDLPEWIANPSAEYVFEELIQQSVWSLIGTGHLRLLAQTVNREPLFLYVGTTGLITIQINNGQVIYKDFVSWGDPSKVIIADHVSVRRLFAVPGSPIGMGTWEPASTLISTALYAQEAFERFFGNNMFMDLIFIRDGEFVQGASTELLTKLAKRHSGSSRAFRPLVTDNTWKVERLTDSNQANQVIELYGMINTHIATLVFGIDPLVFSLGSSGRPGGSGAALVYQNASNLRSQVWNNACKPIARAIAGCISDYLPDGYRLHFSAAEMLRGSPHDRATMAGQMAAMTSSYGRPLFTPEEIREVLGYSGPAPDPKEVLPEGAKPTEPKSVTPEAPAV